MRLFPSGLYLLHYGVVKKPAASPDRAQNHFISTFVPAQYSRNCRSWNHPRPGALRAPPASLVRSVWILVGLRVRDAQVAHSCLGPRYNKIMLCPVCDDMRWSVPRIVFIIAGTAREGSLCVYLLCSLSRSDSSHLITPVVSSSMVYYSLLALRASSVIIIIWRARLEKANQFAS